MTAATAAQMAVATMHYCYNRLGQSNPNTGIAQTTAIANDAHQQDTYATKTKWDPAAKNPTYVFWSRLSLRAGGYTLVREPAVEVVVVSDVGTSNTVRLYLRNTTDSTTGLPSTEQSTRTSTLDWITQATNNALTTAIGTAQTTRLQGIANDTTHHYVGRWVSPKLSPNGIPSGTWSLNFAASTENTADTDWPVSANNQPMNLNVYVWRPATSTKIATILDGATNSDFNALGAADSERVVKGTFSGAAVAAEDMMLNDVVILEIWGLAPGGSINWDASIMYGGTTENTTANAVVSNHAAFIDAPSPGFPITSGDNVTAVVTSGTTFNRSPSADSTTVADSSTTRMLTANRAPSADSPSIGETLTRNTQAFRSPSSDSVTAVDSSTTQIITRVRVPSSDSTTVADSSLTQMITRVRLPSTDSTTVSDSSLTRLLQSFRSPSSDSVTVGENLTGGKLLERAPSSDSITVVDSSLTRLLSALRVPSADTVVVDETLTRSKTWPRVPSADSITVTDSSLTRSVTRVRVLTAEDVTVADSSVTRLLSALRLPSTESITTGENLTRILSAMRSPSSDSVSTSESVDRVVTNPGQFNRSPNTESVTVGETLSRALQLFRVPSSDSITVVDSSLLRSVTRIRTVSADTVNVVENSLTRIKSANRSLSDSPAVIEASLTRLLQAMRLVSTDTVTVAELQNRITHSRSLQETISVTEPLLQRIVTRIRSAGTDNVTVTEQVFFETFKRLLIESVTVAEQLFITRQALSGPVTYATPPEVRPLLGNLGAQRTDAQINLAIDSAYDEINRKTNRTPPNDWKDTEPDFSIIKKIARYKAALEMSIGIKDFEDREAMQKEVDEMFMIIEQHDPGGATSNDIVISSEDTTYALNPEGVIWSTRYKGLRKASSTENDTTINPDT